MSAPPPAAKASPIRAATQGALPPRVVYGFLDFGDGGAQRVTLAELRQLDRSRFDPALLCLRGRGALVAEAESLGVSVIELGRLNRPRDLAALPAIAAALREMAAEVLIVQQYSRSLPYLLAAAHLALTPLRIVRHHGYAPPRGPARRLADGLLARGARHLAVCEAVARELRAARLPHDAVSVHRHGVDLQAFAPADRSAARAELGLPADRPLVLVPARLDSIKGHADLLDALPEVLDRCPGVQMICLGEGPEHEHLQAQADSAGLSASFTMVGRCSNVARWLAACDVVCLPSRAEGLPLALIEAHAAGRAVLATTVGGVPEIVLDGLTGRLVPPAAPPALAAGLLALLGDGRARDAMGVAARKRAEDHFALPKAVRRLEDLWAAWLSERGRIVPPASSPATEAPYRDEHGA